MTLYTGGCMTVEGSVVVVEDSEFSSCSTSSHGGGMAVLSSYDSTTLTRTPHSDVFLTRTSFIDCYASTTGGGLYLDNEGAGTGARGHRATMHHVAFTGCIAYGDGAGIYAWDSALEMMFVSFTSNTATGSQYVDVANEAAFHLQRSIATSSMLSFEGNSPYDIEMEGSAAITCSNVALPGGYTTCPYQPKGLAASCPSNCGEAQLCPAGTANAESGVPSIDACKGIT